MSHTCGIGIIPTIIAQPIQEQIDVKENLYEKEYVAIGDYIGKIEDNGGLKILKEMYIAKLELMRQHECKYVEMKEKYDAAIELHTKLKQLAEEREELLNKRECELKEKEAKYETMKRDMILKMTESAARNDAKREMLDEQEKRINSKIDIDASPLTLDAVKPKTKKLKKKVVSRSLSGAVSKKPVILSNKHIINTTPKRNAH